MLRRLDRRCVKQWIFTTIWHRFVVALRWTCRCRRIVTATSHIVVASIVWIGNVNFVWSILCRLFVQWSNLAVSLGELVAITIALLVDVSVCAVLAARALTTTAIVATIIDFVARLMAILSSVLLLATTMMLYKVDESIDDFLH